MTEVILYGDVSPNVIDGSSIWMTSMAETLSRIFDRVHVQLKQPLENNLLVSTIEALPNIVLHEPESELSPSLAADHVSELIATVNAQAVVVRGMEACNEFCMRSAISPILWAYITDLPFPQDKLSPNSRNRLIRIALRSRRLFAQTEAMRSYLEGIIPEAAGKTVLLNPMIPDYSFGKLQIQEENSSIRPLHLVYAGKFARAWKTLEMLELPRALRKLGITAQLDVIGEKYNRDQKDPSWLPRMQEAIKSASSDPNSGVVWHGALSRTESIELISAADIGIGWRSPELDGSLELSTKALEYAATHTAPLVNCTSEHINLFGDDYPLFVGGKNNIDEIAQIIANNISQIPRAAEVASNVAQNYSMASSTHRLRDLFERAGSLTTLGAENSEILNRPRRVVVASHDLKFMGELMDYLTRHPGFEIKQDKWTSLHAHDEIESQKLAKWADVVFCEWAGPALRWYSQNKKPESRLISRLHRFELDGPWLQEVEWENVDALIFVSELYRRMGLEQLPIPSERTHVIPNTIDSSDFDRPKFGNAQFTLGFVGMVPVHKRPDRALDLLEALLKKDDRYTLRFKGRMPWDYPYIWKDPVQRSFYAEFFSRIAANQRLKAHIAFDGFSADIASWNRGIGFILSPSEVESFHMAPAEGMSSRGIPIFWSRPGVGEIFGEEFASHSFESSIELILSARDNKVFEKLGEHARSSVLRWDPPALMKVWKEIL